MIPSEEYRARRETVARGLPQLDMDALLVSHLPNIRYLTGFTGSNALLLVTRLESYLFTDPRYDLQARRETSCKVTVARHPILAAAARRIARKRYRVIGVEPSHFTMATHAYLKNKLPGCEWKPVIDLVETIRMVKSDAEIALIRRAVATNSQAFTTLQAWHARMRPRCGNRLPDAPPRRRPNGV
jgi:Xaa-Pro aminopeptidase